MSPPPTVLYKYYSLANEELRERVRRLIQDFEFYASSPKEFNDPFDCRVHAHFDISEQEFVALLKKGQTLRPSPLPRPERRRRLSKSRATGWYRDPAIQQQMLAHVQHQVDQLGVFCLSEVRDSLLMWAHYANDHRGICIGFDTSSALMQKNLRKVTYANDREFLPVNAPSQTHADVSLLQKALPWSYEREWRFVCKKAGLHHFPRSKPSPIRQIVLGHRADPDVVSKLLSWLQPEQRILTASPSDKTYSLVVEPFRSS